MNIEMCNTHDKHNFINEHFDLTVISLNMPFYKNLHKTCRFIRICIKHAVLQEFVIEKDALN